MKRIVIILLMLLPCAVMAQEAKQDSLKLLFVGNSYTYYNDLPQMVYEIAKTKKKTLYCNRVQPDSNKKCNEIGPKNRAELQSTLFGFEDYNKAVERNYQRAKRTEDSYVKDIKLGWDDYYAWLDRVQQAKKQWLNEEITDEDFLNIVHELD